MKHTKGARQLLALSLLAAALGAHSSSALAQQPAHYQIEAGSLTQALNRFAAEAGVTLQFAPELTRGLSAPGLHGQFSIEEGLAALLAGSGLRALRHGDGIYVLSPRAESGALELGATNVSSTSIHDSSTEGTGSYTQVGPSSTATGLNLSLRETPQSVTVMTRQRMDDFKLETLADVMAQTPGVTVERQAEMTNFTVRGSSVNLQTDGNRQLTSGWGWNSHIMYSLDDMAEIDRIEVLKGSSGLINGDGAYGATINLIRKRPTADFQANVRAGAGSWDTYRSDADVSGPLSADGSLRGRMVAAYKDGNSFLDHRTNRNSLFYGTLEYDLTPDTLLGVSVTYKQRELRGAAGTTPIQAFDGNGNAVPRMSRSFNIGAPWAGYEQDSLNLFARLEHSFANGWTAKLQVAQERIETPEMLIGSLRFALPGQVQYGAYKDIEDRNESVSLDLQGPFQLFGREHDLLVGAGLSKNRTTLLRGAGSNVSLGALGIEYAQGGGAIPQIDWGSLTYSDDRFSRKRRYAYSAARFSLADPVKLIVGVRTTDYQQKDVTDISWYNYDMRETGVVTPYAGLVVDVSPHVSLYASYASIFEAQSSKDMNESSLPPKEGLTYEVGAKGEFFDRRLNASIAHFWMRVDNEAEVVGLTPSGETAYRAVAGAITRGYEVELSGELAPGWQAQGSYVMNSSTLDSASSNPQHQFKLGNTYAFEDGALQGLTVGAATRWQSGISTSRDQARLQQEAYWLFDLMSRYQVSEQLSVSANVNNLFDKQYFSGVTNFNAQGLFYTWGEPRNFNLSARYDF
ncbi:TonB-dependent siderophore receptor [Phytopseudomonas daroniae]|uniref:TonB-dependent siderophore receptor n=1 Tax=Phytopseudomonas daroniae TaxID=2487519 RepID=UPI001038469E|nr:TonB-dependent siderophore receptor [Pseudomonas daroniae]TBU76152.1 TonB-dependent siderophore receptor [Pseudomonas daroniae]